MLVPINNTLSLNPDFVISIKQDYHGRLILIRDSSGETHEVERGYGESIFEAQTRIAKLLSKAPG